MLPMTVLRRFDCVLAPTKAKVLAEHERSKGSKLTGDALDTKLSKAAGQRFHNHTPLDFAKLSHNGGGNNVRFGDSFTEDQFPGDTFDYFLTNPPFGVDWKKQQKAIEDEHRKRGFDGHFGAGLPHLPDAWMDRSKDKVGFEINFNRHFYEFTPPRPLAEIDAELKKADEEIMRLLREVTE
jgi:type I restriction-modification system DNA methylase subunit